ncbi:MAG: DUF4345 family protein [Cyclobacteriaceae bacterium]
MKLTIARLFSFTAGLFCLAAGLYVLWRPIQTSSLLSYSFQSLIGLSEFLVFYGGFSIGMGFYFITGAIVRRYLEGSLFFLAVSSLAAALTRLAIIIGNEVEASFYFFLAGETTFFILGCAGVIICRNHYFVAKAKRNQLK